MRNILGRERARAATHLCEMQVSPFHHPRFRFLMGPWAPMALSVPCTYFTSSLFLPRLKLSVPAGCALGHSIIHGVTQYCVGSLNTLGQSIGLVLDPPQFEPSKPSPLKL